MKRRSSKKPKGPNTPKPGNVALSEPLKEALVHFMEYHPAKRFSKNLRNMLLEFLMFEGATESKYLPDLLYDLDGLFQFLEVMQEESEALH